MELNLEDFDMDKKEPEKTSSYKRRVIGYVKPKTRLDVDRYCERTEDSESKLVSIALEQYFQRNPEPKPTHSLR